MIATPSNISATMGVTTKSWIGPATSREARIIQQHLYDEVQRGVLTPEEYARMSSAKQRFAAEWQAFKTQGTAGWSTLAAFHDTAIDLAFRKWHLSRGESLKGSQKTTSEDQYRQQLATLRARITGSDPKVAYAGR